MKVKVKYDELTILDKFAIFTCAVPTNHQVIRSSAQTHTRTHTTSVTVTHHYRWRSMLSRWRTPVGVFGCWSLCTATGSGHLKSIDSTTVSRCCVWKEVKSVCAPEPRWHTAAWRTRWRPCLRPSRYHTPSPSCHYDGPPLYQSSDPGLLSVWLLSSLHAENTNCETIRGK